MSALGQKRTCAVQNVMSALPPIADMCSATRHVRFVPIADISGLTPIPMLAVLIFVLSSVRIAFCETLALANKLST